MTTTRDSLTLVNRRLHPLTTALGSVLAAGGRVAVLKILLPAESALEVVIARLARRFAESGKLLLLLFSRGSSVISAGGYIWGRCTRPSAGCTLPLNSAPWPSKRRPGWMRPSVTHRCEIPPRIGVCGKVLAWAVEPDILGRLLG